MLLGTQGLDCEPEETREHGSSDRKKGHSPTAGPPRQVGKDYKFHHFCQPCSTLSLDQLVHNLDGRQVTSREPVLSTGKKKRLLKMDMRVSCPDTVSARTSGPHSLYIRSTQLAYHLALGPACQPQPKVNPLVLEAPCYLQEI